MSELKEWEHIEVYNSAKSDLVKSIIEHFDSHLTPDLRRWLNIEAEMAQENIKEAIDKKGNN